MLRLFHDGGDGVAVALDAGEEGLGGAELQEHVEADGDVLLSPF